jgi:hypothetical protein
MNESPDNNSDPEQQNDRIVAEPVAAAPVIDRNLGAALREDSAAMLDDLQKAKEVVAHLPAGQSVGQARLITHLQRLLQESSARFGHLQESITAMRQERHRLANEVMRAQGLELMVKRITSERDQLKAERDGILQALADEAAKKHALRFDPRDVQVVELTVQVVNLKRELGEAQRQLAELQRKWDPSTTTWKPKTAASETSGFNGE